MGLRGSLLAVGVLVLLLDSPASQAANLEPAARAYAAGEYEKVIKLLSEAQPLGPEGQLLQARTLINLGNFHQARGLLKDLFKQLPHMRDLIRFLQGEALFGLLKFSQAATLFRDAARAKRSRWVDLAWRRRAEALMAGGLSRSAAKQFSILVGSHPRHPDRAELELSRAKCIMRLNRRKYAAQLQEIWLRWPATRAAREARQLLNSLRERGVRPKAPSLDSRILQIRSLRKAKQFEGALRELARLRRKRSLSTEQLQLLDLERVKVHLKNGRPSAALPLLQELYKNQSSQSSSRSATYRLMLADCLARLGRVEEGKNIALSGPQKGREARRVYLGQTARLLKRYGRYAESLKLYREQDAHLPQKSQDRIMLGRAWLAYRAGEYDLAIKGFRHLRKHKPREKRYALYWEARAEARAGRPSNALAVYQQLVERHLRTYYGLLARSRLVEAGKLKLTSASCSPSTQPASQGTTRDPMVREIIDRLITRHGTLYPSLRRARTLWDLGMMKDFLREMHLIGMDYSWVRAGGRVKWDDRRRAAERFWRGGPPIHRRWSRRDRAIIKERATIGPDLGELMDRVGIFYYGWRYRPDEPDPVRKKYPRGYRDLVLRLSRQHDVDPNLVWAVMRTESAFRTDAISRADARGLMQVMPKTASRIAREMGLQEFHIDQLFDPEVSLKMAVWYLKALVGKFKKNIQLVAAGYNGGPHNVALWLDQRGHAADLDEFIEEIPFSESRRYAKKITRLMALYERVYCGKDDRVVPNKLDSSYGEFPSF